MAKVTVRKETGKLVIDFTYRGVRCREQTALGDSPENRRRAEAVIKRLRERIRAGTFVYGEFFPGSLLAERFSSEAVRAGPGKAIARPGEPSAQTPPRQDPTPTFRDFTTTWLAEHQIEWRRSHVKVLVSTLQGHLLPAFGDRPVGSISKADVLAFRNELASKPGRTGEKLGNKRINNVLGVLRRAMADAAERYGFTTPCTNIRPLKVRKSDVQPFSLDQVQLILATVRPDWRDYFTLRFLTGLRTGEAHGLKWKYVDFERRLILIRETFVLGEDEYTKTDSSQRDIQMSQPVYEALRRQQAATAALGEYVFCTREGTPLDNKNFSDRVWYPLLRHLGFAPRRPYQMRHTAATLWLASGEAPEWVARQLGHASTQMLFQVYSRYVPNMTRQDGSAIDRLLATRFASTNLQAPGEARPAQPPPQPAA
jgi:integrase